jgi:hypothetical protein
MVTVGVSKLKAGAGDSTMSIIRQIVSGGETGADRTALERSVERGIRGGGGCRQTRLAGLGANSRGLEPAYELATIRRESGNPAKTLKPGTQWEGGFP